MIAESFSCTPPLRRDSINCGRFIVPISKLNGSKRVGRLIPISITQYRHPSPPFRSVYNRLRVAYVVGSGRNEHTCKKLLGRSRKLTVVAASGMFTRTQADDFGDLPDHDWQWSVDSRETRPRKCLVNRSFPMRSSSAECHLDQRATIRGSANLNGEE